MKIAIAIKNPIGGGLPREEFGSVLNITITITLTTTPISAWKAA
jgi:hypothetical protein